MARRVWAWVGRLDYAARLTAADREALAQTNRTGDVARCDLFLGQVALRAGEINEARRQLQHAESVLRPSWQIAELPELLVAEADCDRLEGRHDNASTTLEEAINLAAPCGMRIVQADALALRARIRLDSCGTPAMCTMSPATLFAALDDAETALRLARDCDYIWAQCDALELLINQLQGAVPGVSDAYEEDRLLLKERLEREVAAAVSVLDTHLRGSRDVPEPGTGSIRARRDQP